MPKLHFSSSSQQRREIIGQHLNRLANEQGSQKEQDIRIRNLSNQPGLNSTNRRRHITAHTIVQLLNLLSVAQAAPAITPARSRDMQKENSLQSKDVEHANKSFISISNKQKDQPAGFSKSENITSRADLLSGSNINQTQTHVVNKDTSIKEPLNNISPNAIGKESNSGKTKNLISPESHQENRQDKERIKNKAYPHKQSSVTVKPNESITSKDEERALSFKDLMKEIIRENVENDTKENQFVKVGEEVLNNYDKDYNAKYPSVRELAKDVLKENIQQRFNLDIDPDKFHFLMFKNAQPGRITKHHAPAVINQTLTQCLFTNFGAQIQDNLQDFDTLSGIYKKELIHNKFFYSSQELAIKPTAFNQLVWDIDFYNYAKGKVEKAFQNKDAHIKKQFIDFIRHLNASGINNDDAKDILKGSGLIKNDGEIKTYLFDINGYTAANAFVFYNKENGHVSIYFPNSDFKFMSFKTVEEMKQWVIDAANIEEHRKMIASHFTIANRQDGTFYYGVDEWLKDLNDGNDYRSKICTNSAKFSQSNFFEKLVENIKDKYISDLDPLIKSDSEVIRDMWERMIDASNIIPNPLSPFLSLGIHLEHAVNGDTDDERKAEWAKIKNDAIMILSLVLMDRAVKFNYLEGYDFIDIVKDGLSEDDAYNDEESNKDENSSHDVEDDCYRAKGTSFGKICSEQTESNENSSVESADEVPEEPQASQPHEIPEEQEPIVVRQRVIDECERVTDLLSKGIQGPATKEDLDTLMRMATLQVESQALDYYNEQGSENINKYLRYGVDESGGMFRELAEELLRDFSEFNDYDDPSYRVMMLPEERITDIRINDVIVDKGFGSSSALLINAQQWMNDEWIIEGDPTFPHDSQHKKLPVLIVYDTSVTKKVAGNDFLPDQVLVAPSEKLMVDSISTMSLEREKVTVIGVSKYTGNQSAQDIYTGNAVN